MNLRNLQDYGRGCYLFNYTHDEKYLEKAEELLISSEILSCGNEKLQTEVLYVLSKYQSLKGNER